MNKPNKVSADQSMPNILYIDIDSLRPDHLGCYGYGLPTSPNIDAVAQDGQLFTGVHASDAPCMPSRTALMSGRMGLVTGLVGHGGSVCEPYRQGPDRAWAGTFLDDGFAGRLRGLGFTCATISSFAERHGAWHWLAGFDRVTSPGKRGHEMAHEVAPLAIDFIERAKDGPPWFLHVNFWDPHTPYRTPEDYSDPFGTQLLPDWLTADLIEAQLASYGPHSASEPLGWGDEPVPARVPDRISDLDAARCWYAGYDIGIHYADHHIGRVLDALDASGQADDTIVVISADHGENMGELNVWGDHQTADRPTCNVPLVIRWPGAEGFAGTDRGLHYHFDWTATVLERLGADLPETWQGRPFSDGSRDALVTGQGAWSAQRGVQFTAEGADWTLLRTYDPGFKPLPPVLLFNVTEDPGQTRDLADARADLVGRAMTTLDRVVAETLGAAGLDRDPLMTLIAEGGPFHVQGRRAAYCDRLRATGRAAHAMAIEEVWSRYAHRR